MIVFTKIRYKNFLSSGNSWTELELNTHKNTLIIGPNGSGKSTLLDALTFSLFGKPFRKVNKGNVINSINGKHCMVEVEFGIGKKSYLIKRGVKPNVFEIYCDGVMMNQDASTKDYQDHLEKNILKVNFKSFTQIVILGSASFTPFMQLSPADRRSVIEDLLDIQIFSAMSTVVKNRLQVNKETLEKNRLLLTSKQEKKSYVEKTLESLKANNESKLADLIDQATDLERMKTEMTNFKLKKEDKITDLLKDVTTHNILKKKHTTLITLQSKLDSNKKRIYEESQFYNENDTCPTCKQSINEELKSSKIGENHNKLLELTEALNKIDTQINDCLTNINQIEKILEKIYNLKVEVSNANVSIQNLEDSILSIKKQIDGFDTNDNITQDNEKELGELTTEVSNLQKVKETILEERKYIELAATLLKDGGIKTKIIKQYLPIINKNINKYLAKMGFFVDFNINESFEETIKSRYRDEFTYNNFSEGEKLRIDLSLLLTWRQIAKLKNSVNMNLLIFDEILDRAMDDVGIEAFLKMMWDLGKDTNVFVISHRETAIDKFERTISFKKVKNFSVMSNE